MKKIPLAAAIAAIAVAASVYASPYYALHQIKSAVKERNAPALAEHVDFPALRDSVKAQLTAALSDSINAATASDNPFAALGKTMVTTMLGNMIDAMVSPEGVVALMNNSAVGAQGGADTGTTQEETHNKADYTTSYAGWNTFSVQAKKDGKEGSLVLQRHGLWSWKLAAIDIPHPAAAR